MSRMLKTGPNILDTNYNLSRSFRDRWSNPNMVDTAYWNAGLGPVEFRTDNSSVVGGKTTFDPSIRRMQDDYLKRNDELRGRYMGNQSAFRQALLDPLKQKVEKGRAEITQGFGQRGMAGSSFMTDSLKSYDMDTQRELGNTAAQAEQNDLMALNELNMNDFQVQRERFAQELAGLNLGKEQMAMLMGEYDALQKRKIDHMNAVSNMFNAQTNAVMGWIPTANAGGGGGSK